MEPEI